MKEDTEKQSWPVPAEAQIGNQVTGSQIAPFPETSGSQAWVFVRISAGLWCTDGQGGGWGVGVVVFVLTLKFLIWQMGWGLRICISQRGHTLRTTAVNYGCLFQLSSTAYWAASGQRKPLWDPVALYVPTPHSRPDTVHSARARHLTHLNRLPLSHGTREIADRPRETCKSPFLVGSV